MGNEVILKEKETGREGWTLAAIEKAAEYVVQSKLFGVRTREEAVVLMLLAQAEGLHPVQAMTEYYVVNGRPALKAEAMLRRFLASGGRVEWHCLDDKAAEATFFHPAGGTVRIAWTIEDAQRAGLNSDAWKKYPRAMLRSRVISEGIRTVYPVAVGIYTPEEAVDIPPAEPQPAPEEKENGGITGKQLKLLAVLMGKVGLGREEAHRYVSALLGREIGSAKELSREEASRVIDHLQELSSWFDALEVPEDLRREVMADASRHGDVFPDEETLRTVVEGYRTT